MEDMEAKTEEDQEKKWIKKVKVGAVEDLSS